jgi:hypothetical protein
VKEFQKSRDLVADGIAGIVTVSRIQNEISQSEKEKPGKKISERNIQDVALSFGIEKAAIKAVIKVESLYGTGFLPSSRPLILFEGHIFWWRLAVYGGNPALVQGYSDVLYPRWDKTKYKGWEFEWDRMDKAKKLHTKAALESASWGLFQIMGYHWQSLGYESIEQFVAKMEENEKNQLVAFAKFLQANNLYVHLLTKNWVAFAFGYNGEGYAVHQYDTRLAQWYNYYRQNPNEPIFKQ